MTDGQCPLLACCGESHVCPRSLILYVFACQDPSGFNLRHMKQFGTEPQPDASLMELFVVWFVPDWAFSSIRDSRLETDRLSFLSKDRLSGSSSSRLGIARCAEAGSMVKQASSR